MGGGTSEEIEFEKKAMSLIGVHSLRYTNPSMDPRIALRFEGAVLEEVKCFQLDMLPVARNPLGSYQGGKKLSLEKCSR